MKREGNILSPTIRQAWDDGDLHPLTKNNPITATGAHISIIGHITRDELRQLLTATDQGNGFGNRFLWLAVRRSKLISNPRPVPEGLLRPLARRLSEAYGWAQNVGEMVRDEAAEGLWAEVYEPLSEGKWALSGLS